MTVLCVEKTTDSVRDAQIKRNIAKHTVNCAWNKIPIDENGNITADIPPEKIGRLAPWCQTRWKARRALLVEKAEECKRMETPELRRLAISETELSLSRDGTNIDKC